MKQIKSGSDSVDIKLAQKQETELWWMAVIHAGGDMDIVFS